MPPPPLPHYGAPPYGSPYAPPEPRRWENVSTLRVPLLTLLALDAGLALLIRVVPLAGLAFGLLIIVTAVVLVVWLYRARRNAVAGKHQFGPGWAIGGWFVPLANLYIPLRVVLDTGWAGVPPERRRSVTVPVVVWWVFWSLSWFTGFQKTTTETVTGTSSHTSVYFSLNLGSTWISAVCLAAAAGALAFVVHRITVDQERAFVSNG